MTQERRRILALGGSLREGSKNRALLEEAATLTPGDAELDLSQLAVIGSLPLFNQDILERDGPPPGVTELKDALRGADGLLIATPEYNGSVPGVLKNAIDWASRPFPDNALKGKPTAVIGASTSLFGAVWAQAQVRKALQIAGADVLDQEVPVGQAHMAFTQHGSIGDPDVQAALEDLVGVLLTRATFARTQLAVADSAV